MAPQREWFEKDYYKTLGVKPDAADKDITKAYRKLARQFHPDTNPGNAAAEEHFKEISAAYDVVGDPTKRSEYDEARRLGPSGGFGPPPTDGGGGLGDLFSNLFTRGRSGSGRGAGPQRGGDIEAELTLSFTDAVHGLTTNLSLVADTSCTTCSGSGAAPGTAPRLCQVCGGRGVTEENQGPFSFSSPCYACGGRGRIVETPCPTCRGTGTERKAREVKVRIPAGVDDQQRIRLKGRGQPGHNGGPAGDLIVLCKVQPHAVFGRDGRNLLLRLPVTFPEAALGAEIDVPLLDHSRTTIRLAPGTQNGSRHRVKGRGVETAKGTGDLIITVVVVVPAKLTSAERKAVEALAAATKQSPREFLEAV